MVSHSTLVFKNGSAHKFMRNIPKGPQLFVGTLRNHDHDGNGNVKKAIGLMSKTTTLHLHHAFLYISLPSLHNYDQISSLLGNGNGKAINSTISVRTWARSPLFSSSQNPRLLSNWTNWEKSRKSFKWCEVYFSATFSWTWPSVPRSVRVLRVDTRTKRLRMRKVSIFNN